MYLWVFASVLIACEQVAPEGDPLQPVAVDASAPLEEPVGEVSSSTDSESDGDEVFSISSEELLAISSGEPEPEKAAEDTPAGEGAPVPDTKQEVPASAEVVPAAPKAEVPAAPTVPVSSGWGEVLGKSWPVRLVTTVPNATPPRAILGLPDGREVVVNPGSMVPDMGLVVVAIAPNSAELARIAPAGDHATIETMTLRAQY